MDKPEDASVVVVRFHSAVLWFMFVATATFGGILYTIHEPPWTIVSLVVGMGGWFVRAWFAQRDLKRINAEDEAKLADAMAELDALKALRAQLNNQREEGISARYVDTTITDEVVNQNVSPKIGASQ